MSAATHRPEPTWRCDVDKRRAERAVYVISVAAELAGVHPQTLRIYERRGLVEPARTGGGSRRYSDADIDRLRRIQESTADGMNLDGVKRVLELERELDRLRAEVHRLRGDLDTRRSDLVPVRSEVVLWEGRRR